MLDHLLLLVYILIAYNICLTIYRLCFHPLASYPGPKLTAASHWVECYHDVFQRGKFIFKLQEWHAKYGPIIRINPEELHVDDFGFYDTLYGGPGSKRDKYEPWCRLAGSLDSTFATPGHELHRKRRKGFQNFFSKASIVKISPLVARNVAKLERNLEQAARKQDVVNLSFAYFALTMDVIAQYSFNDQNSLLDDEELTESWYRTLRMGFESGTISRSFPWMFTIVNSLPDWLVGKLSPPMLRMQEWRERGRRLVKAIANSKSSAAKDDAQKTVFHVIINSDLPPSEKSVERLVDEAQVFLGAGSETTSRTLAVTTYHLLTNPDCLNKLQCELPDIRKTAESFYWARLEQLPYLSAVISEGLRLSYTITTRLPRVAVGEQLVYQGRLIPKNIPVGMTQYLLSTSPQLFPDPETFRPERWLNENGSYNLSMSKLVINFGQGSRSCLGINLAYAELHMALARVFSRFDLELFETGQEEIEMYRDFFTAIPRDDAKGVRVLVKERSTSN